MQASAGQQEERVRELEAKKQALTAKEAELHQVFYSPASICLLPSFPLSLSLAFPLKLSLAPFPPSPRAPLFPSLSPLPSPIPPQCACSHVHVARTR